MRLIDRSDIELWASKIDSKGYLPILVSRLVKATTPVSTFCEFPSGSAANVGGWDGIVNCHEDCGFVPNGTSLWEFGTESSVNKKANEDYTKRTEDPLGYDPKNSTFVFLTPRFWRDKEKFKQEKLKEKIWDDIKVYDSRNIEEWLDDAFVVSRWFSQELGKVPGDGVITTDEFWKEWAFGPGIELSPSLVTNGRERESQELFDFLCSDANIKGVKASTKDEAIAFIIASAKQFEQQHFDRFFSKSLIVDKEHSFRSLRANKNKLNLVAKFEDVKILFAGVVDGHHVLVPLGADDTFNNDIILLPDPPRDGQVIELVRMGFQEEEAQRLSRESARNLTILKRLLRFPQNKILWLDNQDVLELIPALLLGRWNENNSGDKEIIETFAGIPYTEYQNLLFKWRDVPESPLIQIGQTWRLTSPLDAWSLLSSIVKLSDLNKLENVILKVFTDDNLELDTEIQGLTLNFQSPKKYSSWAREGLLQSLILIGLYGDGLKLASISDTQLWVDNVIDTLLENENEKLWMSLDRELPLLAEASPNIFLQRVSQSLTSNNRPIMALFNTRPGLLMESSSHTGLLWALEGLAWVPDYFLDSVSLLMQLAKLKPKIQILNQPINSLKEIFKTWHYQTFADFDLRMDALKALIEIDPVTSWDLLLSLLPSNRAIAYQTHTLRWRQFGKSSKAAYSYNEMFKTHSYVVDLIINNFTVSEPEIAQLISRSEEMSPIDRGKILSFIESKFNQIDSTKNLIWNELGKTLSRHRAHPTAEWALAENQLVHYEQLYDLFEPQDPIFRTTWLFSEHWLEIPETENGNIDSFEKRGERLKEIRIQALKSIIDDYGINKVIELSSIVKEPWILGQALAGVPNHELSIDEFSFFLNNGAGPTTAIQGYCSAKSIQNNHDWSYNTIKQLDKKGFTNEAILKILLAVDQNPDIWTYINDKNGLSFLYWENIQPNFYRLPTPHKLIGLGYLSKYKRYFTAINEASHYSNELPTLLISQILFEGGTEDTKENSRPADYAVSRLFDELYSRQDLDKNKIIQLEWLYIEFLDQYGTGKSPRYIQSELLTNPEFFVEIITWIYMPKNKNDLANDLEESPNKDSIIKASKAYRLLNKIRSVPGYDNDKGLNDEFLFSWVSKVRELAINVDRIEATDSQIGQILAQYPEDRSTNWPPEIIAKLIEQINTQNLKSGFSSAVFNKRGSSSRGAFDGGDIERNHAEYFEKLSAKHRIQFPNLAHIFADLAKGYRADAKNMDDRANRDKLDY